MTVLVVALIRIDHWLNLTKKIQFKLVSANATQNILIHNHFLHASLAITRVVHVILQLITVVSPA